MLDRLRPVLYADDSADDRFIMQEAWKEAGVPNPLELVPDGPEALEYLGRGKGPRTALVLLDIKMPRMTGLEALRRIRELPPLHCLPVLMLTASLQPGDVARAYELGANGYLVKPSALDELVELLAALKTMWKFTEFPPESPGRGALGVV